MNRWGEKGICRGGGYGWGDMFLTWCVVGVVLSGEEEEWWDLRMVGNGREFVRVGVSWRKK